jgi:ParB-like chromosome segregation protein Spo0J
MTIDLKQQPVSRVQWVHRDTLKSNDYNPNHVAPPELELLILSILASGYTCPIVVGEDHVIIDGFHRWHTSADPRLLARYAGMVPCTVVPGDRAERMAATVRHNRARGEHGVMPMAALVREMLAAGCTQAEIMTRLGMEDEEVIRLVDRAGMPQRMAQRGTNAFGKSWAPKRQV